MFLGTWERGLDDQGRLELPAEFRGEERSTLFITRGFEPCLQVFPAQAWEALVQRIETLPLVSQGPRTLRRYLFGAARALPIADSGLILLPAPLLSAAGLGDRCICVGLHSHFEIWAPERWSAYADQAPSEF